MPTTKTDRKKARLRERSPAISAMRSVASTVRLRPIRGTTMSETRMILTNLKGMLEAAGSSMDKVVKVNVLMASPRRRTNQFGK